MPKKHASSWWCIHSDPCGICCATVTYFLLCFADYVVCNVLLYPWLGDTANCALVKWSFLIISFLAMGCHCRTMLTDPGAVPLEYQPNSLHSHEESGNKLAMCSRCNGLKPPRAHHCSQCDRCIMKMDHHCPWVNNCVGVNNQKHFVLFTFYTALLSGYAIVLLILRGMSAARDPVGVPAAHLPPQGAMAGGNLVHGRYHHHKAPDPAGRFLLMVLLFLEALLFGLFTTAMCTEQISSILADQTGIERLKQEEHGRSRGTLHNLSETFGRPFSLLWFLPTTVKYHGLTWIDMLPAECEV